MVSNKVKEAEKEVWDYLEEKFPKGKSKLRGEAMVLVSLTTNMGVVGAWEKANEKELAFLESLQGVLRTNKQSSMKIDNRIKELKADD